MTGKGRTGPRERQTMSGMLGERRDATPAPLSNGPDLVPPSAKAESVIVEEPPLDPLSVDPQSLVQLSLWKRVFEAAEREFERDETPARLQDLPPTPDRRSPRDRDRDDDER
jgi:hypothetical protein